MNCPYCGLQDPILIEDFEEKPVETWDEIVGWIVPALVVAAVCFAAGAVVTFFAISRHLPWPL